MNTESLSSLTLSPCLIEVSARDFVDGLRGENERVSFSHINFRLGVRERRKKSVCRVYEDLNLSRDGF